MKTQICILISYCCFGNIKALTWREDFYRRTVNFSQLSIDWPMETVKRRCIFRHISCLLFLLSLCQIEVTFQIRYRSCTRNISRKSRKAVPPLTTHCTRWRGAQNWDVGGTHSYQKKKHLMASFKTQLGIFVRKCTKIRVTNNMLMPGSLFDFSKNCRNSLLPTFPFPSTKSLIESLKKLVALIISMDYIQRRN